MKTRIALTTVLILVFVACLLLLDLSGCGENTSIPTTTTTLPFVFGESAIAFISQRNSGIESGIYLMNPDGSNQVLRIAVSALSTDYESPNWSRDGQRFVFTVSSPTTNNKTEIYAVKTDGTGLTRLTNNSDLDLDPCWSPDSSQIVFRSDRYSDPATSSNISSLHIMNASGGGEIELARSDNTYALQQPCFSPDGTKIAYVSSQGGSYEIWVMNSDGTGVTMLTNDDGWNEGPSWSPDGTKIAYIKLHDTATQTQGLYVMDSNGANKTLLLHDLLSGWRPGWSPDSGKLVYQTYGSAIYIINADGSGNTLIAPNTSWSNTAPTWSPKLN